jgi:hypothetical protein
MLLLFITYRYICGLKFNIARMGGSILIIKNKKTTCDSSRGTSEECFVVCRNKNQQKFTRSNNQRGAACKTAAAPSQPPPKQVLFLFVGLVRTCSSRGTSTNPESSHCLALLALALASECANYRLQNK